MPPSTSITPPLRSMLPSVLRPLAAVAILAAAGCTTKTQTFEGYSDEQVWSAMVAAARAPEYDDWKIAENETYVDEDGRRLEVYRVVRRLYVTPHSDPRKESREWRMRMVLARDENLAAPAIDFTARQITVPAHVWAEADRYFNQVRHLLGPVQGASPQSTNGPSATDADPTESNGQPTNGEAAEDPSGRTEPETVDLP